MRIRLTLLAIATAATIALAGCGNDPGTTENASGETTPATTQPAEPSETSESPETSPSASKKPDAEQAPTPQSLDFTRQRSTASRSRVPAWPESQRSCGSGR